MDSTLRAVIAHIAATASGVSTKSAVFDFSKNNYVNISGNVNLPRVQIHEYHRNASVSGSLPNLHDYGGNAAITLKVNGAKFDGYDYGSGQHYSGSINGSTVNVFDYETGEFHCYSV